MNKKATLRNMILSAGLLLLALAWPVIMVQAQDVSGLERQIVDDQPIDPRFGIVEAFWKPEDTAELGAGWDRILFYWNEIQPAGPDDWNTLHVLEEWLDDARAADRKVMGLLKNTPPWATDAEPFSGVPRGLYLPVDDPQNLWATYVRKVVEYYAPLGVHHWIIWNEPEIAAGVYGHEFSGSTRDYYQLVKVAYQVAKAQDPDSVIHLAGWSYWHDPNWLGKFLQVVVSDPQGAANNYFFDVITLHIYFRVETVEELVQETWDIQRFYGLDKPIWINETNASPNLDPFWPVERPNFQVDLEQQAWYVIQAHALGFGANSESVGIYKLLDILLPEGGESFGILRPDGSRRPAFDAYKTTIRYLSGFTFPVGRQQEQNFYSFSFKRPEGVTRILWARNSTDMILRVPALADEALLVAATGEERTVSAFNGYYRIRLRGARCAPACDIGGPPVFIVENTEESVGVESIDRIDPQTAILATATPTPSATATTDAPIEDVLTPVQDVTQVETETPTPEPTSTSTVPPTPTMTPTAAASSTPIILPTVTPPTVAQIADSSSPDSPIQNESQSTIGLQSSNVSWLFIGAALILAVALIAYVARRRVQ